MENKNNHSMITYFCEVCDKPCLTLLDQEIFCGSLICEDCLKDVTIVVCPEKE